MNLARHFSFVARRLPTATKRLFSQQNDAEGAKPSPYHKPANKVSPQRLTPATKELIKSEFRSQLQKIESQLGKSEIPIDYQNMRPQEVLRMMDTSIEGFFFKRDYNLENFNFLLQALAEKRDKEGAIKAFDKMKSLDIVPNRRSYNQLLTACSKAKDVQKAEEVFAEAQRTPNIGVDKGMYNSLMLCYTRRHEPEKALQILYDMRNEGLVPDVVCYTTAINAFKNSKNIKKAWEIYDEMLSKEGIVPDENLYGLMMEICSATHDAERAVSLFNKVKQIGFLDTCLPYNAAIKALGSRKDYAADAIKIYEEMLENGVVPDSDTYVALFKATSNLGDVKTAYNALMNMKGQKLPVTQYHYNGLLRTYAGACKIPRISEETKQVYISDAWKLFEQMQTVDNLPVNVHVLNSLMKVHTNALDTKRLENFVLPLYEKYGVALDAFSYENMTDLYWNLRELKEVVNLMESIQEKGLTPTFETLNSYLETAMRLDNRERILEALRMFTKIGKEPKRKYLRELGTAEDIPDEIFLELNRFKLKFGYVGDRVKQRRQGNQYSSS